MEKQLKTDVRGLLGRLPLFAAVDVESLDRIAGSVTEHRLARGEVLFRQNSPCTGFYLVAHGQIKLAVTAPNGNEKVLELIPAHMSFGEAVMFMDKPYMVFAQALADSLLLHISKSAILDEIERDPMLGRKMIASLSMRLHHLITDVESYSLHSGRQRIIGYLLRDNMERDAQSLTVTLPTSKGVIASRLNLTQEHFSRILHELSALELIKVEGRRLRIPDLESLARHQCELAASGR